jgi:hypothetical protein
MSAEQRFAAEVCRLGRCIIDRFGNLDPRPSDLASQLIVGYPDELTGFIAGGSSSTETAVVAENELIIGSPRICPFQ